MDVIISKIVGDGGSAIKKVVVRWVVVLRIVDYYNRIVKETRKRKVGVLLGSTCQLGGVYITNGYAGKEHVIGHWYSTGPKRRENEFDIHEFIRNYCPNPVLVIIDVHSLQSLVLVF